MKQLVFAELDGTEDLVVLAMDPMVYGLSGDPFVVTTKENSNLHSDLDWFEMDLEEIQGYLDFDPAMREWFNKLL